MLQPTALLAAAALAGLGCSTGPVSDPVLELADLPATVTIAVGHRAVVGTTAVDFIRVGNDSRCPSDVVCVWAGNAEIELGIGPTVGLSPTVVVKVNTNLEPRAVTVGGLRFTVTGLTPEAHSGGIPATAYRVELKIETFPTLE